MPGRALLLLVVCVLACLPQLVLADWHGTEGRRVQIALEMARSGDWLVPTLGGQATWAKPPLHYWLLGSVSEWAGASPFWLRVPAVLGLFAAALLASELLRRWFGPGAGWVGGLGVLLSPVALVEMGSAEIDPLFASLTAMSLWCLATGVARERRMLVVWSGVLGGLALLQKGPPYFLFASGAYLVWWRRRGLRFSVAHFVPLLLLPCAYYAPLLLLRDEAANLVSVASEETIGRLNTFRWDHVTSIPGFWARAVAVQMPLVLWCFWEWRGARDARLDAADLTLRMCSGAAVLAVVALTFFPGRPTRYLLPNALLFTFAVAPAVAHFAGQQRELGTFARRGLGAVAVLGALALVGMPLVAGRIGLGAAGLALAAALAPRFVATPRQLVAFCLWLPLLAMWTVGLQRSLAWPTGARARAPVGEVLRRELTAMGAIDAVATRGHVDSGLLLGARLLPPGDEMARAPATARWVMFEPSDWAPVDPVGYVEKLRVCAPGQLLVVSERAGAPR